MSMMIVMMMWVIYACTYVYVGAKTSKPLEEKQYAGLARTALHAYECGPIRHTTEQPISSLPAHLDHRLRDMMKLLLKHLRTSDRATCSAVSLCPWLHLHLHLHIYLHLHLHLHRPSSVRLCHLRISPFRFHCTSLVPVGRAVTGMVPSIYAAVSGAVFGR